MGLWGGPRDGLVLGLEEEGARGSASWGQSRSGWVAETRETDIRPEPSHRLAHDPSGKPNNHSTESSEEPETRPIAVFGPGRLALHSCVRLAGSPLAALTFPQPYAFAISVRCVQTFSKALPYWPINSGTSL